MPRGLQDDVRCDVIQLSAVILEDWDGSKGKELNAQQTIIRPSNIT